MTRNHRRILKRASKVGDYFQAKGEDARPAWELLNAKLIEGSVLKNREGAPVEVAVTGITLAGRDELARPFSRICEWLVHALDILLGAFIYAAISKLVNS